MDLAPSAHDRFGAYLTPFTALAGDRRTARLVADTIQGIIASESLICARIAAFSPWAGPRAA